MRCPSLSRLIICFVLSALALVALVALADDGFNPLRDGAIDAVEPAPPMMRYDDTERRLRSYPEQPPTIPHAIAGYEISLRANKCLACHSRRLSVETGAPMISVSHFMDRDLQVLSDVSPRRYFCSQCHVPQTSAALTLPVANEFIDSADLPQE